MLIGFKLRAREGGVNARPQITKQTERATRDAGKWKIDKEKTVEEEEELARALTYILSVPCHKAIVVFNINASN